jgi:hypothetical protein
MSIPLVTASGEIKGGRLVIRERRAFDEAISSLRPGLQVEVEITRLVATRSLPANRYYWGVVVHALSQHTGYTPEEMHDWLKVKFLPKHLAVSNVHGDIVAEFVLAGSTRGLNSVEFTTYVEQIKQWSATDLQVYIPDADEYGYGAGI